MTASTQLKPRRPGIVGRVIAVFGALVLAAVIGTVCLGIAVVRSFRVVDHTGPLRAQLLAHLNVPRLSQVEVSVPPWLVVLGRVAASISDLDPRVNQGLSAVRSGQVGVYQLGESPSRKDALALIEMADEQLGEGGWNRIVTVLEEGQLVAVYESGEGSNQSDELDAFVIVLDQRELVMVSARGRMEPLAELASGALAQVGLRDLRF